MQTKTDMPNQLAKIDNIILQQTPEGVELALMPAGMIPRASAWVIDAMIRGGLLYGFALIMSLFGKFGMGLWLVVYFLLDWFYPVYFEVFRQGQTIGKKRFGILVCQDDGTPINWQASMIRNLLRVADFLPFAFGAAIVAMLFNQSSKRLGDMVAGTMVVYIPEPELGYEIPSEQAIALPLPLQLDEQQAILAYAERLNTFSTARAEELANILVPLTADHDQPLSNSHYLAMPQQIVGYANTIIGKNS